jgi:lipopolysaccharide transport system ATP-binding protein
MYVRLAFAVAAHLEPEILVVDEVLAVGDAEFQKKCLGKMDEVSRREGRTVLFVSHNMAAIDELANRVVLLERGTVAVDGLVPEALSHYLSAGVERVLYISPHDEQHECPHVARAEILTSSPNGVQHFGEPMDIKVWIRHLRPMARGCLGIHLVNQSHASATALYAYPPEYAFGRKSGTTVIRFHIPRLRLNVGKFHLRIFLTEPPWSEVYEIVDNVCGFEIVRNEFFNWWGPAFCAYHEEFSTEISADDSKLSATAGTCKTVPISAYDTNK